MKFKKQNQLMWCNRNRLHSRTSFYCTTWCSCTRYEINSCDTIETGSSMNAKKYCSWYSTSNSYLNGDGTVWTWVNIRERRKDEYGSKKIRTSIYRVWVQYFFQIQTLEIVWPNEMLTSVQMLGGIDHVRWVSTVALTRRSIPTNRYRPCDLQRGRYRSDRPVSSLTNQSDADRRYDRFGR